ncbi:hypothetical protein Bca101_094359 [Brassica carinata]
MKRWGLDPKEKTIFLMVDVEENVVKSSRNIGMLRKLTQRSLNLFDVLNSNKMVLLLFRRGGADGPPARTLGCLLVVWPGSPCGVYVCVLRGSPSSVVFRRVRCASDDSLRLLVRLTFKHVWLLFPFRKWLCAFGAASTAISSFHQRGVALKRKKTELGSLVSGQGVGQDLPLIQIVLKRGVWIAFISARFVRRFYAAYTVRGSWCAHSSSVHGVVSSGGVC